MRRSTDPLLERLLAAIERELPRAVELRHRLHAQPELSHAEEQTAAAVAAEMPVPCDRVASTGLVGLIGAADAADGIAVDADARAASLETDTWSRAIAVRAELDALPVRERTGAQFSASGEAMHACGHDVHMAALVALARAAHTLALDGDGGDTGTGKLPAPLLAVFQPSEEAYPSGAKQLADEVFGTLASPAAVVAAHVHPELRWGAVALDAGVVNASCDAIEVTITGESSHSAYPHLGRDPILALSHVVVALHAQAPQRIDPLWPAVLSVGVIEGGTADNVIPAHTRARVTLRAHRPRDRLALRELVEEVVTGVAAAHGCSAHTELTPGEPALENDAQIVAGARELLAQAGLTTAPEWRSCGCDDFAFFGAQAPLAMAFVGLDGAAGFERRPLHHPELLPPDEAVGALARAQAVLYCAAAASTAENAARSED